METLWHEAPFPRIAFDSTALSGGQDQPEAEGLDRLKDGGCANLGKRVYVLTQVRDPALALFPSLSSSF